MWFNLDPDAWQALSLLTLMALVFAALMFDVGQRRIPNQLVLLALVAGFLFNSIGPPNWLRDGGGLFTFYPGALGVKGAAMGAFTGLVIFLPFYPLRAMGAGDVKLMAGIGSFVGPVAAINLALFILVTGGVLALIRMAWLRKSRRVLANVLMALGQVWPGPTTSFDPATQSADYMPYGIAIAGGLLAYGIWIFSGYAPLVNF